MNITFQLWINDYLSLAGCSTIETCKINARKDAYNEVIAGQRKSPTYYIRTNEGSTIAIGTYKRNRMIWRRPQ